MRGDVTRALCAGWLCFLGFGVLVLAFRFSYGMWVLLTLPLMLAGVVIMREVFNRACCA
jgi:hypothetical protein